MNPNRSLKEKKGWNGILCLACGILSSQVFYKIHPKIFSTALRSGFQKYLAAPSSLPTTSAIVQLNQTQASPFYDFTVDSLSS